MDKKNFDDEVAEILGINKRKEERRLVRKMHNVSIVFRESSPESAEKKSAGYILDISSKGIGILCEGPLITQKMVTISITGKAENLEAKVAWCKRLPVSGKIIKAKDAYQWRAGLEFNFRSDDERVLMSKLAKTL